MISRSRPQWTLSPHVTAPAAVSMTWLKDLVEGWVARAQCFLPQPASARNRQTRLAGVGDRAAIDNRPSLRRGNVVNGDAASIFAVARGPNRLYCALDGPPAPTSVLARMAIPLSARETLPRPPRCWLDLHDRGRRKELDCSAFGAHAHRDRRTAT